MYISFILYFIRFYFYIKRSKMKRFLYPSYIICYFSHIVFKIRIYFLRYIRKHTCTCYIYKILIIYFSYIEISWIRIYNIIYCFFISNLIQERQIISCTNRSIPTGRFIFKFQYLLLYLLFHLHLLLLNAHMYHLYLKRLYLYTCFFVYSIWYKCNVFF